MRKVTLVKMVEVLHGLPIRKRKYTLSTPKEIGRALKKQGFKVKEVLGGFEAEKGKLFVFIGEEPLFENAAETTRHLFP